MTQTLPCFPDCVCAYGTCRAEEIEHQQLARDARDRRDVLGFMATASDKAWCEFLDVLTGRK